MKKYNEIERLEELSSVSISEDDVISEELRRAELRLKDQDIQDRQQNREQRKVYSLWLFGFICMYMVAVLIITILVGASTLELSDTILVTLLTTTTANVFGLFIIVAKYLFHTRE